MNKDKIARCGKCGEQMPEGETIFKFIENLS
jgi:hypothetical protein